MDDLADMEQRIAALEEQLEAKDRIIDLQKEKIADLYNAMESIAQIVRVAINPATKRR